MNWIQDRFQWRDIINTVMEIRVHKWREFLASWVPVSHNLTRLTSSTVLELECFASVGLRDVLFLWEQREWSIGLCDQCPCLREKERKILAKKKWSPPTYTLGWCLMYRRRWDFWSLRPVIPKILCLELGLLGVSPSVTLLLMVLVLEFLSVLVDAGVLVLLKSIPPALSLCEAYRYIVATINNSTVWVKGNSTHRP